jgi:hypothetical protein
MTMTAVDLRREAAAEVQRLSAARALWRDGDERALAQLEGSAPWLMLGNRASLTRRLGRRVVFVWRIALEDASGRPVESQLVPIMIDVTHAPPKAQLRAWIRALAREPFPSTALGAARHARNWQADAESVSKAFTAARSSREREIAAEGAAAERDLSQPGLFDRRADRVRQAQMQASALSEQAASERLRAIADAGTLTVHPAQLMLVLVP